MKTSPFFKQADLVVQLIPFVNAETCFALKGGTAINFFVRNFPRLSVLWKAFHNSDDVKALFM